MAQDFDEVHNPVDRWYADLKGRLRAAMRKKKVGWQDIGSRTGMSDATVLSVIFDNNVRHTLSTLFKFGAVLDVRITLIEGFDSPRRQPDEVSPLTTKEARLLKSHLEEIAAGRRKKRRHRKKRT